MGWRLREVNGRGQTNYRMKNNESAGDNRGKGQVAHVTDSPIARQTVTSTAPWHHGPGDLAMSADIGLLVVGGGPAGITAALQVAELQLAFPTFTEGVSMAAQKICRTLG